MKNYRIFISIIIAVLFVLNFPSNIFAAKLVPSFPNGSALQPIPENVSPSSHNINTDVNNQNNNFPQQPMPQQNTSYTNIPGGSILQNITMNVIWLIFILIILIAIFVWLRLHKKRSL